MTREEANRLQPGDRVVARWLDTFEATVRLVMDDGRVTLERDDGRRQIVLHTSIKKEGKRMLKDRADGVEHARTGLLRAHAEFLTSRLQGRTLDPEHWALLTEAASAARAFAATADRVVLSSRQYCERKKAEEAEAARKRERERELERGKWAFRTARGMVAAALDAGCCRTDLEFLVDRRTLDAIEAAMNMRARPTVLCGVRCVANDACPRIALRDPKVAFTSVVPTDRN